MRPTARVLQSLDRQVVRAKSTAFIGLGRMGSEMAFNLFSKKFAESPEARFVVCDALPTSATVFRQNFLAQFPGAHIDVVHTPEEYVCSR
jgi:3-hydroxyisobutyrate dehydrogenase